jgi:hypothetical protein
MLSRLLKVPYQVETNETRSSNDADHIGSGFELEVTFQASDLS